VDLIFKIWKASQTKRKKKNMPAKDDISVPLQCKEFIETAKKVNPSII